MRIPKQYQPLAFFVAMLLVFDVAYSLLSTCQPINIAESGNHRKHCTALGGLIPWIIGIIFYPVLHFLETYEHPLVAGFTIVLAISTIGLWLATNRLWAAGEKQFLLLSENAATQSRDMLESLEIARMSAKAATEAAYSERAWMSVDAVGTYPIKNAVVGGVPYAEAIGMTMNWKNTGRSPAIKVNIFSASRVIPTSAPIPTFDPSTSITQEERKGIFGPNVSANTDLQLIFGDDLTKLISGTVKWIVYSRATYSTVFEPGVEKFSDCCTLVEINGDMQWPDGTIGPRITSGPVGPQNTAN